MAPGNAAGYDCTEPPVEFGDHEAVAGPQVFRAGRPDLRSAIVPSAVRLTGRLGARSAVGEDGMTARANVAGLVLVDSGRERQDHFVRVVSGGSKACGSTAGPVGQV